MRKRIPWLIVLLVLGMAVSAVASLFEGVIKELALIVAFQSLILGMAGNVGTQSLAVTISTITGETYNFKDNVKKVLKELRIGLLNGVIVGVLSTLFIGLYVYFFKVPNFEQASSALLSSGQARCYDVIITAEGNVVHPQKFRSSSEAQKNRAQDKSKQGRKQKRPYVHENSGYSQGVHCIPTEFVLK